MVKRVPHPDDDYVIPLGKRYRSSTLYQIYLVDPDYLMFLMQYTEDDDLSKRISSLFKHHEYHAGQNTWVCLTCGLQIENNDRCSPLWHEKGCVKWFLDRSTYQVCLDWTADRCPHRYRKYPDVIDHVKLNVDMG